MKRRALPALLVGALLGCSGSVQPPAAAGVAPATIALPVIALDHDDDGRVVHVSPGQRVEVRLPAHSASGYRCWLRTTPAAVLDLEREPARVAGPHTWRFRGLAAGQGELLFECGQELATRQRRIYAFHVRID